MYKVKYHSPQDWSDNASWSVEGPGICEDFRSHQKEAEEICELLNIAYRYGLGAGRQND